MNKYFEYIVMYEALYILHNMAFKTLIQTDFIATTSFRENQEKTKLGCF